MTLTQTPAVRHYAGWLYDKDPTREHRANWEARYKGVTIIAGSESALKRKIDDWFDAQSD